MDCTALPNTGTDFTALILAVAALLVVGFVLVAIAGRRRVVRAASFAAVLLALTVIWLPIGSPPAQAAAVDCVVDPGPVDTLSIVQTSTMTGLAPNVAPAPIVGRVTNLSTDDTYIAAIIVSIYAITKAPGAGSGACDATDYVLVDPMMVVDEALDGGESAVFSGASIGFFDKVINQDACQGAAVTLLYRTG